MGTDMACCQNASGQSITSIGRGGNDAGAGPGIPTIGHIHGHPIEADPAPGARVGQPATGQPCIGQPAVAQAAPGQPQALDDRAGHPAAPVKPGQGHTALASIIGGSQLRRSVRAPLLADEAEGLAPSGPAWLAPAIASVIDLSPLVARSTHCWARRVCISKSMGHASSR